MPTGCALGSLNPVNARSARIGGDYHSDRWFSLREIAGSGRQSSRGVARCRRLAAPGPVGERTPVRDGSAGNPVGEAADTPSLAAEMSPFRAILVPVLLLGRLGPEPDPGHWAERHLLRPPSGGRSCVSTGASGPGSAGSGGSPER